MKCMCLTNKSEKCKNRTNNRFCYKHSETCKRINFDLSCGKTTAILAPIKITLCSSIWFCCFKGSLAVYKEYKTENNECLILKQIKHDNIVNLLKCGLTSGFNYIITNCYEGDLSNINEQDDILQSSHSQITNALVHLQKNHISHSDIHAKNIFWKRTNNYEIGGIKSTGFLFVLGDFEFSKSFQVTIKNSSYGKRIQVRKSDLFFNDTREYILWPGKVSNDRYKYISSIGILMKSIPIDYHNDLLCLKRCYLDYNCFGKTSYYTLFIKNFKTFSFSKPFSTNQIELFLAEEMMKLIKNFINESIRKI